MKLRAKGFTLVELLITLTIFAVVAVLCVNALVNSMKAARKIQAQVYLYSEAQALMDQIARTVESSAIDYETYYLRYGYSSPETGWETDNYGYYGQAFYNPGDDGWYGGPYGSSIGDIYGAECPSGAGAYPEDCSTETPVYDDLDLDTGAHPYTDILSPFTDDPTYMNAFCETTSSSTNCDDLENGAVEELILVNSAGDLRTIFLRETSETVSTEYSLSIMELAATDTNNDGIEDLWECTGTFSCSLDSGATPEESDFMPISPDTLNIESFQIFVVPMEDPYRGFAEEEMQVQPHVTIVMTVSLSENYSGNLLGEVPSLTIQRTISTGVYGEVESYE